MGWELYRYFDQSRCGVHQKRARRENHRIMRQRRLWLVVLAALAVAQVLIFLRYASKPPIEHVD